MATPGLRTLAERARITRAQMVSLAQVSRQTLDAIEPGFRQELSRLGGSDASSGGREVAVH